MAIEWGEVDRQMHTNVYSIGKKREETMMENLKQDEKHIFPRTCNRKTTILHQASSYNYFCALWDI